MEILGQASLRNNHILLGVSLLEFNNLPVIRSILSIHVTKLVRHFSIDPTLHKVYFKIYMKSLGVKYFPPSAVYYFYFGCSILDSYLSTRILSSKLECILLLFLPTPRVKFGAGPLPLSIRFFELFKCLNYVCKCVVSTRLRAGFKSASMGLSFSLAIRGTRYFWSGDDFSPEKLSLCSRPLGLLNVLPRVCLMSRLISLFEPIFYSFGSIRVIVILYNIL